MMSRALIIAAIFALLTSCAQADVIFSPTSGRECRDFSKPEFGDWICPGPGGYAVKFTDEGNIAGITIAPSRSIRKAVSTSQWLGAGKVFGDRMQWVVRGAVPTAAVLRIWRRKSPEDDTEVQELEVYAIDGAKSCAYATIEAGMAKANETALAKAEQAVGWRCTDK